MFTNSETDLIPNLVETVKGYATHEKGTFVDVTEARAKATKVTLNVQDLNSIKQFQANQGELSSALSRLMVTIEKYPELKANENFKKMQNDLIKIEIKIVEERALYNKMAKSYNTRIKTFPNVILANLFGFLDVPYFESKEGSQDAPVVKFN